ncbi:hypothetical protein BDZ89DRAFT_620090 [Hymenopellis radicata]|nr:hypothetical protein BDZ89DRAFT_620090 [Hymenopellis radicata]
MTVYHLATTPPSQRVLREDAMADVSTNCIYWTDINGVDAPQSRCGCRFNKDGSNSGVLCIAIASDPPIMHTRKIESIHRTQADFMKILITHFAKAQAEIQSLQVVHQTNADGSQTIGVSVTFGLETLPTVIGCLEVIESVSKMIPGFGGIAEGVCATLRKILCSAESAKICRSECTALAEHTALITCAILNEVASSPSLLEDKSLRDLCRYVTRIILSRVLVH